jgi:flavin reductase (DIM6/NTAB) family NADH-FMN oxidoreductase RutF
VAAPRVAEAPAALECRLVEIIRLRTSDGEMLDRHLVLGHVVGVHIDDRFITPDGRFDTAAARPIARCGYSDYAVVDSLFSIVRPAGAG